MTCAAAGGKFSLSGGQWVDAVRSPVCETCPQLDPSVVVCEGNSVVSQPGYYSYFVSEQTRRSGSYTEVAVAECPNREACRYTGLIDFVCETSLSACNSNAGAKCKEGSTGAHICAHTAASSVVLLL